MCLLNKLKKKLHLKKIIDFLNLYKFVVFYHSHKTDNKPTCLSNDGRNVLFLVKCARLRKLAHLHPTQKQFFAISLEKDLQRQGATNSQNEFLPSHSKKGQTKVIHLLRLVTKGGAMGSTRLVGCDSLESMQRCIAKTNAFLPLDYVCLGGIYNNLYIDSADCLRLSRLSTQSVHIELTNTLNKAPRHLQENLQWPLHMLNLSIKANSGKQN